MSASSWSLATVETAAGPVACIETEQGLCALEPSLARVGLPGCRTVISLFEDWTRSEAALSHAAGSLDPADRVEPIRRLAPLLYPGKILCAGANYFDHLAEMGMPGAKKAEQRLFFFMKPPRNAVVGEGDTVHMPIGTEKFDWEVELAAVIGKRARNVSAETALDYVAGWTVAVDFSARDHNRAPETFYKLDWVAGKANDTCCPLGPRIVPLSALPDPQNVGLRLSVNGETQAGWTLDRHDLHGRGADRHRLAHHDIGPGRRASDRNPGRRGRAEGYVPGRGRSRRCRDRRHRTPVGAHTAGTLRHTNINTEG